MPSTVISSFSYNAETRRLRITFVTHKEYEYIDVPEEVYNAMKNAWSKGIFFNHHIRNDYKCEVLTENGE